MDDEIGYIILDVRTQEEYEGGHIPGAICVPNETIETDPPKELPDLDQMILVYCHSGNRSKQAAKNLPPWAIQIFVSLDASIPGRVR